MRLPHCAALLPAAALWLATAPLAPLAAAPASSVYTSTAAKACRTLSIGGAEEDGGSRLCPGKAGLVVVIAEGDLREVVSVGRNRRDAEAQPAARAWFGPFSSTTETIEWRLDATAQPVAIIQRWHLADNEDPEKSGQPKTKQLLVVTRLPPGAVCHVAYVDVVANPNPNEIARRAADEIARDFQCGRDKARVVGSPGRATALAGPR
jgi:hypothetical protein